VTVGVPDGETDVVDESESVAVGEGVMDTVGVREGDQLKLGVTLEVTL
jgi:hypothetical protein